ncbi:Nitroreductase [Elusimicrobium minutum Pei191]|uniref:Nitroreductase n=1 Tax=Elusimicrobium minutum (strain Pei191) TaxID=445932 RepID=B2KEW5_ELUMP|nr:nitroreductase family protein [Elusimicrobium minutum]ACC99061.1 Nitroreductase [Elusimicrobium minutum Pei191]
MQVSEAILKRRSVRKYTEQAIEQEKLNMILEAGRQAPSACNSQPWRFVVFNEKQAKESFCDAVFTGIYKNTMFAKQAPVIIAVVSDKGNLTSQIGNMIRRTEFYLIDQGIACQNMALQAWELGIGSCLIGWFDDKKAAKHLNLGGGKKVELLISLGYPAEEIPARPRKEAEKIISFNKFQ